MSAGHLPAAVDGYERLLDSSRCQGAPTWLGWARDQGIAGLIAQATQATKLDPQWTATAIAAFDVGLDLGAYGVLHDHGVTDARAQAEAFVAAVRGVALTLPLCLDWELNAAELPDDELVLSARVWCELVEDALGRPVMIYTGPFFVDSMRLSPAGLADREVLFATRDTWISDYGPRASKMQTPETWTPRAPRAAKRPPKVWQAGPAGAYLPGGVPVDMNWTRGLSELLAPMARPASPAAQRPS